MTNARKAIDMWTELAPQELANVGQHEARVRELILSMPADDTGSLLNSTRR